MNHPTYLSSIILSTCKPGCPLVIYFKRNFSIESESQGNFSWDNRAREIKNYATKISFFVVFTIKTLANLMVFTAYPCGNAPGK